MVQQVVFDFPTYGYFTLEHEAQQQRWRHREYLHFHGVRYAFSKNSFKLCFPRNNVLVILGNNNFFIRLHVPFSSSVCKAVFEFYLRRRNRCKVGVLLELSFLTMRRSSPGAILGVVSGLHEFVLISQ